MLYAGPMRYIDCQTCNGSGSIPKWSEKDGKRGQWWSACPECQQSGRVAYTPPLVENEWIADV